MNNKEREDLISVFESFLENNENNDHASNSNTMYEMFVRLMGNDEKLKEMAKDTGTYNNKTAGIDFLAFHDL